MGLIAGSPARPGSPNTRQKGQSSHEGGARAFGAADRAAAGTAANAAAAAAATGAVADVCELDDALTRHVGELGPGQMLTLVAASLSWISLAVAALAMAFLSADPVRARAFACTDAADGECAAALAAADAAAFCRMRPGQYALEKRFSAVAEFGLLCGESWRAALANSAFFVGIWAGSSPFGWLSDARGRRTCLLVSNAATALTCLLCAAAPGYWSYLGARTAVGFAAAGLPIGAYLQATESVGPSRRGVAGLVSQLIYHPGEWLLPALAGGLRDWRMLNVAIAAVAALAAAAAAAVWESPRWLLTQGRGREAEAAVRWLAALNGRELPQGVRLVAGGAGGADGGGNGRGGSSCGDGGAAAAVQPQQGDWRLLFSHPLLRRALLVSSGLAGAAAVVFYAAALATDALEGYSIERAFFVTSLAEVPAYILGVAAIDTIGRRPTLLAFFWLSAASSLGCALAGPGPLQVALATVNRGVISAAWGSSYVVTGETVITPLRASALSVSNQVARLGGVAAPAVPFLAALLARPALPFLVMGAASLAASAGVLLLPETRGRPQVDTTEQLEALYGNTACSSGGGGGGESSGGGSSWGLAFRGRGSGAAYKQLPVAEAAAAAPPPKAAPSWLGSASLDAPPRRAADQAARGVLRGAPSLGRGGSSGAVWGSFTSDWGDGPAAAGAGAGAGAGAPPAVASGPGRPDDDGGGCLEMEELGGARV
ncbi:hypothetical protein Rsub_02084 [Raphidocelis subcapitata]|uniref:Major facilitator superfamily (MFS) profile domain-containing protein n=1 Tax=Raphidocelis subcapitata TaxID=307507 RepID=A0A2V0NS76_9CHLO|nr:hypothetical protein Rsub_02084 [Raphidocelis subcapitata]|eukprot:GBF89512.1 hypothetical protein Rsub_02084 [Raphidocelis subcapitata]